MRIGVLTGGGDCPGLNAVIRAVVTKGVNVHGHEFVGFRDGWKGPVEGLTRPLGLADVDDILARGGTILGSSRTNPYKIDGGVDRIRDTFAAHSVDALVAIGGEDTLGVAKRLTDDGIGVVGVPKTIDNDLGATDYTFGFDTAVGDRDRGDRPAAHDGRVPPPHPGRRGDGAARRLDRAALRAGRWRGRDPDPRAAVRHRRRSSAGWRAATSAGGRRSSSSPRAPRRPTAARRCSTARSTPSATCGSAGSRTWLAEEVERRTGHESRSVVLGHVQRGGTPTAYDRVLSTRFGLEAIDAVHEKDFGKMVALRGTDIVRVPLSEATAELKTVPPERYAEAEAFFG